MNNEHPITPPPELVQQWWEEADQYQDDPKTYFDHVATEAAQWGSDQELEACVNYIDNNMSGNKAREFRAIRRPKPPSLKEQALDELKHWDDVLGASTKIIRRALEQLDD